MFTGYVLIPFSFLTLAILAKPSHSTNDQTIHLSSVLNLTSQDQLFPSNASIQDPNPSSGNELDIQCDGANYGYNPSISDCEGARSDIPPDSEQLIFGERHTGLPESTVSLPYILMGDKAECYFQPINIGDGATARASLYQIRNAASALFLKCASNNPSQGGIVKNIGGDNNLAVIMGVFKPKVQCRGYFDTPETCTEILADMPATPDLEVFGPKDTPFVKEILPQEVVSYWPRLTIVLKADDKCVMKLYSTGSSDVVAWYRVWEAVEATYAVCGRSRKSGSYRGIGLQGNVFLTLGPRISPQSTVNSSNDATA
ncbi:hypothetical protein BDR22DRAFT_824859 [Usnea florida]